METTIPDLTPITTAPAETHRALPHPSKDELPEPSDAAPLFGQIRQLGLNENQAYVSRDVADRVKAFVATRSTQQIAEKAIDLIFTSGSTDAAVLAGLRALIGTPAKPATPAQPPAKPAQPARATQPPQPRANEKHAPRPKEKKPALTLASLTLAPVGSFGSGVRPKAFGALEVHKSKEPDAPCCGKHQAPAPGTGREQSRLRDVEQELKIVKGEARRNPEFTYLDIGCAEGRITAAVAEALQLPADRAHACDVVPQAPGGAFTFTQNEGDTLPYGAESFDFGTMFMAAHHFADAPVMFREASRVIRKKGRLLVRDHNCVSESQRLFYDVVHALYGCVLGDETTPEEFVARYAQGGFAHYRSSDEWLTVARSCGFELDTRTGVHGPVIRGKYGSDRFDSFYAMLVRVH